MRKFTICMCILATLGVSSSKVVLANGFENDSEYKANNIEVVSNLENNKTTETTINSTGKTGWVLNDNKYFFIEKDGQVKKNWYNDGYDWYHLDNNTGEMTTGWYNDGSEYYYLNDNGTMATGWIKIDNEWYYLRSNGVMEKGWLRLDNNWYFLNDNGTMVTGYKTINGKKYYFKDNGVMDNGLGLVVEARKHIGKAYVSGGNGPNSFDCSGLTKYVYKQMEVDLTRTTYTQVKQGNYVARENLKLGDLVFSHGSTTAPGHVGIYSGNGKYIHAANTRQGVIESPIYSYATARRIVND